MLQGAVFSGEEIQMSELDEDKIELYLPVIFIVLLNLGFLPHCPTMRKLHIQVLGQNTLKEGKSPRTKSPKTKSLEGQASRTNSSYDKIIPVSV